MFFPFLKPWLRSVKYNYLYKSACKHAADNSISPVALPGAFIVGCGRSGTTLLGDILSSHNEVSYLFEPYYLWAAIDPRLDILNLFADIEPSLYLDDSFFLAEHKHRFERCLTKFIQNKKANLLIEKTPLNIFRIGWIEKIYPGAKFIHIVRDGFDVAKSIERLATTNSYKIFGKPNLNQWWGNNNIKWKTLRKDSVSMKSHELREIDLLDTHISKAAYEWSLSLKEAELWQAKLGDRFLAITYQQLVEYPLEKLTEIACFLEIELDPIWLEKVISGIHSAKSYSSTQIVLPKAICREFNYYQEKYGFLPRAQSSN
ncbi:sulfotransferase [Leptolyngbyaceae cyanobacterium CCMR0082]|uniref:Sulfotransferase n=1 Tax=Adonisia turfae CCMR0082 TaxID=2304604 RepID=A0A6M0SBU4_9CYAN|nr:sulfotransferase [Adonisia turfae]NEZ65796.1 sulfotransferase [Adonisia turfae CCMR0082]